MTLLMQFHNSRVMNACIGRSPVALNEVPVLALQFGCQRCEGLSASPGLDGIFQQ